MVIVLVAGFGAFLDVTDNPSARLATSLDGRTATLPDGRTLRVVGRDMPVSYARGPDLVAAQARQIGAAAVLGIGVARGRAAPMLETTGRRTLEPSLADVDGVRLADLGALQAGPEVVTTTWPVAPFVAGSGFGTSDDAGSYVCNAWLWRTTQLLPDRPVGFLHIPDGGADAEALLRGIVASLGVKSGSAGKPDRP
jgi:pyrrolidone-carboxylate peptidase